jgi:hypothetical protein
LGAFSGKKLTSISPNFVLMIAFGAIELDVLSAALKILVSTNAAPTRHRAPTTTLIVVRLSMNILLPSD